MGYREAGGAGHGGRGGGGGGDSTMSGNEMAIAALPSRIKSHSIQDILVSWPCLRLR